MMTEYDAAEEAYKKGYADAQKTAHWKYVQTDSILYVAAAEKYSLGGELK